MHIDITAGKWRQGEKREQTGLLSQCDVDSDFKPVRKLERIVQIRARGDARTGRTAGTSSTAGGWMSRMAWWGGVGWVVGREAVG